jgi:hypothetical protein
MGLPPLSADLDLSCSRRGRILATQLILEVLEGSIVSNVTENGLCVQELARKKRKPLFLVDYDVLWDWDPPLRNITSFGIFCVST